MSKDFFKTSSLEEAMSFINKHVPFGVGYENCTLINALSRVLAEDIISGEDLPPYSKSTVDGYAVRSADTFGATEGTPLYLEVIGEVEMGTGMVIERKDTKTTIPSNLIKIPEYTAIRIPTGGMMPEGADGALMVEYTQPCGGDENSNMIEVTRSVSPGENVIHAGEDIKIGDLLFQKGHQVRPQDIGVLAGLGITLIQVYRRPKVAIISSGPEICPIEMPPPRGQVRDINAYCLAALILESAAEPVYMGIVPDDLTQLKHTIRNALAETDCVLLSGGSSVGERDFTCQAISALGPPGVMIHGLSIRPGKPTIIGQSGTIPIIGLPGHPASALIVAKAIVVPLITRLSGRSLTPLEKRIKEASSTINARLTRNIPSSAGKEEFIRVTLTINETQENENELYATPLFGKSGLISTFINTHGLVNIPANTEGAYEGEEVEITLL